MDAKHLLFALAAVGGMFTELNPALAQAWVQTGAPTTNWSAIVSSADGSRLAAVVDYGGIYVSTNSGATWAVTSAPISNWVSVASSADGTKLVTAASTIGLRPGLIYTSTNSGATWAAAGVGPLFWSSVASSADGCKLVCVSHEGALCLSTNGGAAWITNTAISFLGLDWFSVASSPDGAKLVAVAPAYNTSVFYLSTNSGVTWTNKTGGFQGMLCVAISADGTKLAAADTFGFVWISADSGTTWMQTENGSSVAMSADGTKLVGAENPGRIHTSTNSGATWTTADAPYTSWSFVAFSADGSRLVAVIYGGGIYTWQAAPVLNVALSDTNLVVSWLALSSADGFGLQQNSDLMTTTWTDVPTPPTLTNGQYQVIVSPQSGSCFYRPIKP